MKTCSKCDEQKSVDNFYQKNSSDSTIVRYDSMCKPCRAEVNREYRNKNRESIQAKNREWYYANRSKINQLRSEKLNSLDEAELQQHKEKGRKARESMRQRRIDKYLEENGEPPLCKCGCGNRVIFNDKGKPNLYILNHHNRDIDFIFRAKYDYDHRVCIKAFRKGVFDLKEQNGWTVTQVAERGGIAPSHLEALLYDKKKNNKYGLDREWAENFFKRLLGRPAPPSTYQLKQFKKIEQKDRILKTELENI